MLKKLDPFTLTQINLNKYYFLLDNNIDYKKNHENKKKYIYLNNNREIKENNFLISHTDKYFWAFYIFLYSFEDYYLINNHFIIEKNFKINNVIKIREEKDKLKLYKISRNFIENELVNENKISLKTLNCLALLYNLNIIYIKKRIIYIMNYGNEKIINCKNIIEESDNNINLLNLSEELIQELIDTYYIINNINKSINAISYYKLGDLINIAKKLNLEILNKQKKDLYNEISNYINF